MTTTETRIAPSDLYSSCVGVKAVNIEWSEWSGEEGESWTATEAFNYDHNGTGYTLVASGGTVVAVYLPDGTRIDANQYDTYRESVEDEDGELSDGALSEEDFNELCQVDTYPAQGPMMSYYYPLDGSTFGPYGASYDAIEAAYRIRHLSLCIVELDGDYVLALTGGGMDLTWEIVRAYVTLHLLPPVVYCIPPSLAGGVQDEEYLAACMAESLRSVVRSAQRDLSRLAERYPAIVPTV